MKYFFWTGCAIIIPSIVVHIRRHNALIQYIQEAKLNDPEPVNKSIEDDFISSM